MLISSLNLAAVIETNGCISQITYIAILPAVEHIPTFHTYKNGWKRGDWEVEDWIIWNSLKQRNEPRIWATLSSPHRFYNSPWSTPWSRLSLRWAATTILILPYRYWGSELTVGFLWESGLCTSMNLGDCRCILRY